MTGIAHSPDDTSDLIDMVGGAPLVIKLVEGTQGIGVVLAETRQAAESVIDAFRGLNAHILVQEYIEEAKGRDIRCFVVGNEVFLPLPARARHSLPSPAAPALRADGLRLPRPAPAFAPLSRQSPARAR